MEAIDALPKKTHARTDTKSDRIVQRRAELYCRLTVCTRGRYY